MNVLITGADGFIGKNLCLALAERKSYNVLSIGRRSSQQELEQAVRAAEAVIHLAGINRPTDPAEFESGNHEFTKHLCEMVAQLKPQLPIAFSSSIQAAQANPYGQSKLGAETQLQEHAQRHQSGVAIFRLPNVFGKWCRSNYNSVVATFCHNLTRDLPIEVHDPDRALQLVYVDDVVHAMIQFLETPPTTFEHREVQPVYGITLGELRDTLAGFNQNRLAAKTANVGEGLTRALYATYVSYLEPQRFTYRLTKHADPRGVFVEMLKTPSAGQFSYFTAKPGITRGGHYHHTKTEKFLVISGHACFKFRHILTNETYQVHTSGDEPTIVETVPGWVHDVTNTGDQDLVVMLWANEVFDPAKPDTIAAKLTVDEA